MKNVRSMTLRPSIEPRLELQALNRFKRSTTTRPKPTSQPLTEPTRVAPGVVLIPAAGHTPGSLYVFVALANGQEVLLVGDTVWSHHNLNRAVGRPLAVSLGLGEDREGSSRCVMPSPPSPSCPRTTT